jgi:uncharacterized protein DUF5666
MEVPTMNFIRSTHFVAALVAVAILSGCGSSGVGDILGGGNTGNTGNTGSTGTYDPYNQSTGDVRGTVKRVDTLDRRILVDTEASGYSSNLRNGNEEVALYYDDRTTVTHEGRTYRPQDLESGDRISADVERSGDRLVAQQIEVLYDVSGGGAQNGGTVASDLRGTVRYVDTRARTFEVEPTRSSNFSSGSTGSSSVVVVQYDSQTTVEFQGRRYQPENLERGDLVQIELRDLGGGRLLAEQIVVLDENQPVGR